jgi:hypothetical protein
VTGTLYKLTDRDGYTRRGQSCETIWTPGRWVEVPWGGRLCEPGCLHAYRDPLLAALMDPIHARLLPGGRLWTAEGTVRAEDSTKIGCDRLRVLAECAVPEVSAARRVRWAVLCAQQSCSEPDWLRWAKAWLGGQDRSAKAANAAASAADAAAAYAASAAAASAADAASAAYAALAAVDAGTALDLRALAQRAIEEEP